MMLRHRLVQNLKSTTRQNRTYSRIYNNALQLTIDQTESDNHHTQINNLFHNGMKAKVTVGGRESDLFDVLVGVKQCVLAPVIFNFFLVAVTLACRNGLPTNVGIPYAYRLDGSLFNLRRLKAETKISNNKIYELQYADEAAIPAHSAAVQISRAAWIPCPLLTDVPVFT